MLEVRVCGGVEVEVDGRLLPEALIGGRQGRLVLAYLACERDRAVRREELAELLWPEQLPESWTASLSAVISRLRRLFTEAGLDGPAVIASTPGSYQLRAARRAVASTSRSSSPPSREAEDAAAAGDVDRALAAAAARRGDRGARLPHRRLRVGRRTPRRASATSGCGPRSRSRPRTSLPARRRARSRPPAAPSISTPSKEAAYRQLMRALAAAGERGEALRVWERCRITLVEELGVDPSPETEAVYLELLGAAPPAPVDDRACRPASSRSCSPTSSSRRRCGRNTPTAMAAALERHDAIVGEVVAAHGGTLLKSKLEGDATVSVFARATEGAAAALALLDALDCRAVARRRRSRACAWRCTPARRSSAAATTSAPR